MNQKFKLRLFFCFCLLLIGLNSFSQDVIILKNGDEIQSKVMEVSTDIIKYKKWDNQDGPIYSSNKLDVFMIKYQNGRKDVFNVAQSQTNVAANNNTSNDSPLKEAAPPVDNTKDVYVGDLKDGKKEGYGKMVYENGNIYEGEWKDDKRNGQGKFYTPKGGNTYNGGWEDDKKGGYGTITWDDGTINYQGGFKNGQPDGQGITYDKGKKVYDGEWKNGKKNGKGILNYETKDGTLIYTGYFVNDAFEGQGTYTFNDIDGSTTVLTGSFLNGRLEGQGTETVKLMDGRITTFTGEFKSGKYFNGILYMTGSQGRKGTIEYKNGKEGNLKKEKAPAGFHNSTTDTPAPTSSQNSKPPGCEDVDFLGAFKISGDGVINDIYVATIRNRAAYTKTVHIEWIDGYGKTKKAAFDVKAGEKIDGRLGLSTPGVRPPTNVRMTSCN